MTDNCGRCGAVYATPPALSRVDNSTEVCPWCGIAEALYGFYQPNEQMPALTEERRRELTKVVRNEGEAAKIAIRNLRRDANEAVKKLVKDKLASEDEQKRSEADIQKLTDRQISEIDRLVASKEQDIMAV